MFSAAPPRCCLGLQVVTGILLALVYVPSASEAWNSLQFLNHNVTLGWFLRAVHGWGSNFMIAIVLIHMAQVFLFGAYKFPRELTWIVGVLLLLLTLGMAFTGQVLRFDQDAYWGLGIGASIMSRVPGIGASLVHALLGGPIIGGATLSRFFTLHVFVIPGILLASVGLHVWMVLRLGINEWPMPGRLVRKSTYEREYHELIQKDGIPFVPDAVMERRDLCGGNPARRHRMCFLLRPVRSHGTARSHHHPNRPETRFRVPLDLRGPGVPAAESRNAVPADCAHRPHRRPVAAAADRRRRRKALVAPPGRGADGCSDCGHARRFYSPRHLHSLEPDHGRMDQRSGALEYLHGRTPLERQGALVLQGKQCRDCHSLGGLGGLRGPALDSIAARMTEDQITRQVLQGGGNMPSYGNALNPVGNHRAGSLSSDSARTGSYAGGGCVSKFNVVRKATLGRCPNPHAHDR